MRKLSKIDSVTSFRLKHCIVIWALVGTGFIVHLSQQVRDTDIWWHLAAGRYMLQSHSIPTQDPFSFTTAGSRWIPHEWLSDVLLYAHYQTFGIGGVVFCRTILAFLLALSLYLFFFRRTGNELISAGCSAVLTLAGCISLSARPQLFSCLLLISLLRLIDRWRRGKSIWVVVPLFALWVNLHGAWIVGLVVLTVVLAEECIISLRTGKSGRIGHLILVYASVVGALFINPVGYELVFYPLQRPGIRHYTINAVPELPLLLAIIAGIIILARCARAQIRVSEWVMAIGSAAISLYSVRHVPIFTILAAPLIASQLKALTGIVARNRKITAECVPLNLLVVLALPLFLWLVYPRMVDTNGLLWQAGFPQKAADFLWSKEPYGNGRILAPHDWGGYLIFRLHPAYKVSIDGRYKLYGKKLIDAHNRLKKTTGDWRADLNRLAPDVIIWPVKLPLVRKLEKTANWERVYQDEVAVVMVKRD